MYIINVILVLCNANYVLCNMYYIIAVILSEIMVGSGQSDQR